MRTELLGTSNVEAARRLVEAQGLAFESEVDDLVGVFEGGELLGVGARRGNVLKTIAVVPSEQGGPILGAVVTGLVACALADGHDSAFVFTRPSSAPSFEALGFELLASVGSAALLEWGGGMARWLDARRERVRPGANGAVVVNCNPFTLGHRHLIREAARAVATLYAFVVREDRSAFPFAARLHLVREGTRDLPNVLVLDTGCYAVSAITFPSYFLKQDDDAARVQTELDVTLFGRRIAPFFGIRRRFFGTEPICDTTRAYNDAMRRLLPSFGVEPVEVPRLASGDEAISASRVRAFLREGRLDAAAALVPSSTLAFLNSDAGWEVREKLRREGGRHS